MLQASFGLADDGQKYGCLTGLIARARRSLYGKDAQRFVPSVEGRIGGLQPPNDTQLALGDGA